METVENGMNERTKMTFVILIFAPSSKLCIDTISNLKKRKKRIPRFLKSRNYRGEANIARQKSLREKHSNKALSLLMELMAFAFWLFPGRVTSGRRASFVSKMDVIT